MPKSDNEPQQFWRKFGVITVHPRLPSLTEQVAAARAWGVVERWLGKLDTSALFIDDVSKVSTTNWGPYLKERRALFAGLTHIDPEAEGKNTIFFHSPLCVGFSSKQAQRELDEVFAAGWTAYVHTRGAIYAPGDDLSQLLAQVDNDANVSKVRASRAASRAAKKNKV